MTRFFILNFSLVAGFDSPTCHKVFFYSILSRLLPARESRHSHTATEGAQRCIFVGKGKEVYVLICVIGSSPRRFDSAHGRNNFNV
nr:MAG TPA: hypothetical protein [Caudoviricetes sp.]